MLNFSVAADAVNTGIEDVAKWQLGPLEPLLFSVTSTPPGSSCGVTAGLRNGTPDKPGRTIFRPSETCAVGQPVLVRARWPLGGKTLPGQLFTAPQIPWTLSRDGSAKQGYRFLETDTVFQYEFSLDGGVSWFVAERPK